jgi:hypothetical protein
MKILGSILMLLTSVTAQTAEILSTAPFAPGTIPAAAQLEGKLVIDFKEAEIKLLNIASFLSDVVAPIPNIEMTLVADDQDVIPVTRGLQITDNPFWDYFIGPGKSWQEGKVSVASLPLTLIYRPVNCSHNGLIRIEYNGSQVTDARILVGQETCHFLRVDISGRGATSYQPQELSLADESLAAWQTETANRLPVYSLDDFSKDQPNADLELFRTGLPDNHDLSTFGFYFEGKHYNAGCITRHGSYPYCDQMLMTSFSTAKTAYAGIVLMAIAQEFGQEVYNTTIASLLPETKEAKGDWRNVTLNHIGDMASGNFSNSDPMADPGPGQFYMDTNRDKKLAAAFSWPNARSAGEFFVYQSADTFIQINAMDAYLRQRNADIPDSFDYLVSRVLKPLNVQPDVWFSRRTRDNGVVNSGTALGGMGASLMSSRSFIPKLCLRRCKLTAATVACRRAFMANFTITIPGRYPRDFLVNSFPVILTSP